MGLECKVLSDRLSSLAPDFPTSRVRSYHAVPPRTPHSGRTFFTYCNASPLQKAARIVYSELNLLSLADGRITLIAKVKELLESTVTSDEIREKFESLFIMFDTALPG